MVFPKNIIVREITHVTIVNFKVRGKSRMCSRPFHGIAFSLNGELVCHQDSKNAKLSGNTVVYLPKNSTYDVICDKGGSFAVVNFQTANTLDVNELISTKVNSADTLHIEFTNMLRLFTSSYESSLYNNLSSLYKIFAILSSSNDEKEMPSPLGKAISYIENNISSHTLSNIEIANEVGISEVYLRKLFTNNLSIPVNKYVQNARLEKAKLLLAETDLSVTDISNRCGYSCIYYFCNSFKKNTGYTPSEYRNKNSHILF